MSYYRLRRSLFEEFCGFVGTERAGYVKLPTEAFLVIRLFLTARNEHLDDNKRLSFDKAIMELSELAVAPGVVPAAGGGLFGRFLGGPPAP